MALWKVEQAAEYLGVRPKTLYEWVRKGRVPHRKIGFNVRFDPDDLRAWTEETARAAEPAPSRAPVPSSAEPDIFRLAAEASETLRRLEKEVGANLSFPQRRRLVDLAARLEAAAGGSALEE